MIRCDYCQTEFNPTRHGQRFHTDRCRSAWHREQSLPGFVTGIRAKKRGGWSVTISYPDIPDGLVFGTSVRLETGEIPRLDASSGGNN